MSKGRGKRFEAEINYTLPTYPFVAWAKHYPDATLHTNPIDFIGCTAGGRFLAVECKAVKGTSLPYSRFHSEAQAIDQWAVLETCWRAGGHVLVFLNHYGWPGQSGQRGQAYSIPFGALSALRSGSTRKSWRIATLLQQEGVLELAKIVHPKPGWDWPGQGSIVRIF